MDIKKGVRFENPPLVEALCEFQFKETAVPPNIILGRLYELVEKDFPTVETYKGIDVQEGSEGSPSSHAIVLQEATRFVSHDNLRFIQISPGVLIADQIRSYKNYISFRKFVNRAMSDYYTVAKPEGLRYIGLRYINHINLSADQAIEDSFNIGFRIPEKTRSFPETYSLEINFDYHDGRDKLTILFEKAAFDGVPLDYITLDFKLTLEKPENIDDKFLEWMDEAHEIIEEAFHACLTESALASFNPMNTNER